MNLNVACCLIGLAGFMALAADRYGLHGVLLLTFTIIFTVLACLLTEFDR